MSTTIPVLDNIPLPSAGLQASMEDKSSTHSHSSSSKRKSSKHNDANNDKDEHSKKKHKKSKKKDKHKDKDREKSKDRKKDKKSSVESELTAIEKFNMFKKQREAAKGDDKIVDDLFKDFIASKLKQIESDNTKSSEKKSKSKKETDVKVSSMDEMNKFLDDEISNISLPCVSKDIEVKQTVPPDKEKTITEPSKLDSAKSNKTVLPTSKVSVFNNPTTLGSLLKLDKKKETVTNVTKRPVTENIISVQKDNNLLTSSQLISESAIPLPPGPGPTKESSKSTLDDKQKDIQNVKVDNTLPVFGPVLPRSMAINDKQNNVEEPKVEIKKQIGFKNFGIKLSATSAELIQSGEIHKKGKRLEEGEVLSSSSGGSDSSDSDGNADSDDDNDNDEISGTGSISDSEGDSKSGSKLKKKKKKKKKGKHKKKKKHKDKDDVLTVGKEKSASKRKVSITPRSRSRSPKRSRRSRSHSRERSRRRSRSRSRGRSRRSRSRSRGRRSSKSSSRRSRSRSKGRRSRSRGRRSRSRGRKSKSRSPDRFWRSKYGDFDAYRFLKGKHDRSRSRSPDRERDRFIEKEKKRLEDLRLRIDKAKLREIAIKNAVTNARSGGPQLDVAIKSGGKSVEELTEYCKKIQEKEILKKKSRNEFESSSDEEPAKHSDDEDLLHHPFLVKEASAIVVDIKNANPLPITTPQERLTQNSQLRITYPVSSGSQHRDKEWVPVEPEPVPPPKPKTNTVGGVPALMPPPAPPKAKPDIKVFEEPPEQPVDISSIVSERLTAMKKLQDNPNDVTAKIILSKAQKQASQWAASKNLPGQFIGSTGASIMSQDELMGNKKRQAWLKKDVFTSAAPVTGGIGMFLLQKMGWKHGEGLGKNNEGTKEPLMLDFKIDRKGLVTEGEGKKGGQPKLPRVKDLSGKHPVSALGELCNKKRWGPPHYDMIHESGPAHKKDFLFKVKVNGVDYQPSISSNNKKLAKAQAATVCLQELGLIPRNISAT
ncbi:protein SON-like isoform X2 [Ruditapes philippinarum]|uniref:protein SON-like isoform X2 n=1 Tax=Ruditapes philippinarum TaxID=129788 RepID=UPI00295ADF48|nr:protein SON-like isoform X2 [Ruditapes philippinarum]